MNYKLERQVHTHEEGACLWIVSVVNATLYFWVVAVVVSNSKYVAH